MRDADVFGIVRIVADQPRARRNARCEIVAIAGRRLLTWRQVGIPDSALAGRREVAGRNSKRAAVAVMRTAIVRIARPFIARRGISALDR